jgi:hypothetical protein
LTPMRDADVEHYNAILLCNHRASISPARPTWRPSRNIRYGMCSCTGERRSSSATTTSRRNRRRRALYDRLLIVTPTATRSSARAARQSLETYLRKQLACGSGSRIRPTCTTAPADLPASSRRAREFQPARRANTQEGSLGSLKGGFIRSRETAMSISLRFSPGLRGGRYQRSVALRSGEPVR